MGEKLEPTDKIVTHLPVSLEILNLYGCSINSVVWFQEFVNWRIRVNDMRTRTRSCFFGMFYLIGHAERATPTDIRLWQVLVA